MPLVLYDSHMEIGRGSAIPTRPSLAPLSLL